MVEPFLPGKAKKALFVGLVAGGALFSLSSPLLASASFFSTFLQKSSAVWDNSSPIFNSQTLPLLAPATNIDPSPPVGGGDIMLVDGAALLAQEGPAGTAADIESQPASSQISVYTVREGDTLSGIAKMFDVTPNTIVWANDIKGGVVRPGDQLIILPITGIQHTVLRGETLAGLAKTYKSDVHDIAQYNGLGDSAVLAVGDVVLIPNGELGGSSSAAASKTKSPGGASNAQKIKNIAKGKTRQPYLGGSGASLEGYYTWPVDGGSITQGLHGWNAVDIGAPKGTGILAAAPGVVIIAREGGGWNGGYGNYLVIQHLNGTQTLYSHASKILVTPGQSVAQGQTIAKVGATGEATGPHLHFEVRGAANPFVNISVGSGG